MRKFLLFTTLLLAVIAVACSTLAPTAPATNATPRVLETLRFSLNGPPDVLDVPRLMAIDTLKAQGYTVEQTQFADQNVIVAALLKGDLDFGTGDTSFGLGGDCQGRVT